MRNMEWSFRMRMKNCVKGLGMIKDVPREWETI